MVDDLGNALAGICKTPEQSRGGLSESRSSSPDKIAKTGSSSEAHATKPASEDANSDHETAVSKLESTITDGRTRESSRILLQAQRIKFHDPANGTLRTVTASDELPQSV